jgi:pentapeptide MXKDX repeat protein
MSEHDELEAPDDDAEVEAHGLREAAVAGISAAALIAGAGNAVAATSPGHASANAKQAVHKIDAVQKDAVQKDAVQKGAMFKGNAVVKQSVSKQGVDPSSRRGRSDAS